MESERAAFEIQKILAGSDIKHRNGLADVMKVLVATSTVMLTILVSFWHESGVQPFKCGSLRDWLMPTALISLMLVVLLGIYHIYYSLAFIEKLFQKSIHDALDKYDTPQKALLSLNEPTVKNTWLYKKSTFIVLFLFSVSVASIAISPLFYS